MTSAVTPTMDVGAERPDGTAPIRLVLAVEGIDTSDGRHIIPGALSTRPMPLTVWAQVRSTHGLEGDAATFVVGAITEAERVPGPTVIQRSTGRPFPFGTNVWVGRGWMYTDVPTPESGSKPAYTLLKDGALYGNSVDLTSVDAEFEYQDDHNVDGPPDRIIMHSGVIGSTTIVGIPAFMDAYAEVDGMIVNPGDNVLALGASLVAAAGGGPLLSWTSGQLGDQCLPCRKDAEAAAAEPSPFADLLTGEDLTPTPERTSGVIALVPAEPATLAVPGGDPIDELHLTLAYLGDNVTAWDPQEIAAVHQIALEATSQDAFCQRYVAEAVERGEDPPDCDELYQQPTWQGPLAGSIFAHAVFNPNGDNGYDPASVYMLDGSADRMQIDYLAAELCNRVKDKVGDVNFPEQYYPFVPHVTAGYNISLDSLTYTGPVVFNRLRVAIGNQRTDYKLGGGQVIIASGTALPPEEWFQDPQLDGPTPHTVTDTGRVYGHLATWDTCHTGFPGRCTTPPRSASSYAYFHVHATQALGENGEVVTIPVGYGTLSRDQDTGGHANIRLSASEAARHYDNTCVAAFEIVVGEDDHGIWYSGRLLPGLTPEQQHLARGAALSGDWRTIRGNLELLAALDVNFPGFPVPRVRVASGAPIALVAAALPSSGRRPMVADTDPALGELRHVVAWARREMLRSEMDDVLRLIDQTTDYGDGPKVQLTDEVRADLDAALAAISQATEVVASPPS